MKKLLSLITALALTASMAVIPVFAEGEGDTPESTVEPLTVQTVTPLAKGASVKFSLDNAVESETELDKNNKPVWKIPSDRVLDETLALYVSGTEDKDGTPTARTLDIDASSKKFENNTRTYTHRLKLGGLVIKDSNGAPAIRTISVTPAEAGTLCVDFAHASSSGNARTIAAYQNGTEIGTKSVTAGGLDTFKVAVTANAPVYIYASEEGGVNIYGILLNDDSVEEPVVEEVVPTPLPVDTTINFDSGIDTSITTTSLYGSYLKVITNGSSLSIGSSNKKYDNNTRTYTTVLKLGGKGSVGTDGVPTNRAVSVIPAVDGVLKVDFTTSTTDQNTTLTATQSGSESVSKNATGPETLSMAVKANVPVYIYALSNKVDGTEQNANANISGIFLTASGDTPDTPTDTKVSCVKVVATYASGALTNVTFTPGEYTAADINGVTNTATEKTFYWKAITGDNAMEPVTAETPDTPAEPEAEPEWGWVAANDEAVKTDAALAADSAERTTKKGYELISGLTTLFDNVSTNKAYIAGSAAGEWSEPDSTSEKYNKASMLKYVPTKDGVLYIKIDKLDANKEAAIIVEGTTAKQAVDDPSYIKATENMTGVVIKREVEAGKTYLVTVKSATGRYNAAAFVEQAVSKTWSGASKAENITAGTELFSGLTTLFADVSAADKKYISGDTNPAVDTETGEVTGSALQFVAPANGTISVTITGLGAGKSAAIYDKAAKTEIDTKTNDSTEKADVTLSATVEAGKTYYIMGKGTNACYSSASFTPAAAAPATTD